MHIAQHDLYNAYQCAICDFADDMEYTLHKHIKTKHDGITPEGTIRGESGKPKKRGRPKVVKILIFREKLHRYMSERSRKMSFLKNYQI